MSSSELKPLCGIETIEESYQLICEHSIFPIAICDIIRDYINEYQIVEREKISTTKSFLVSCALHIYQGYYVHISKEKKEEFIIIREANQFVAISFSPAYGIIKSDDSTFDWPISRGLYNSQILNEETIKKIKESQYQLPT